MNLLFVFGLVFNLSIVTNIWISLIALVMGSTHYSQHFVQCPVFHIVLKNRKIEIEYEAVEFFFEHRMRITFGEGRKPPVIYFNMIKQVQQFI